jgi:hypothetical protein
MNRKVRTGISVLGFPWRESLALLPHGVNRKSRWCVALAANSGALSEMRSSRTFTRGWPLDAAGLSFGWPIFRASRKVGF